MFIFLLLLSVAIGAFYIFFNFKYKYWKRRNVPFPNPTLVFGNTGRVVTLQTSMSEFLNELYSEFKGHSYVGFFNLWNPAILIRDPELVKDVLVKQFNNFHDNWIETEHDVDPIFASNPFVLQGNKWKIVRAQLTPQFTSSKIKWMYPHIVTGCKNMIQYINNQISEKGSKTIDMKDVAARFTGDNVIKCAYGLDGKSFIVEKPDSFKIGEQISSSSKIVQIKQTIGLFFPVLRRLIKTSFLGDSVPRMFKDIILEAIKYREANNIVRNDFLDFIKELKAKPSTFEIDDNYLAAHAFTFFLDGFETSGLTLAYALFELSANPTIQTKTRKEIAAVLEKHNGKLTYEAFQEMEYVDNVIFESLRKHPIIKFISRVCTEEYNFPSPYGQGEEVKIEKGTQIFIPVESIHTDPDYYPNPDNFDPEHMIERAENSRPKCSFLGFGDGPRICLGRKFAMTQVKLGLITILSDFEIRMDKNMILPIQQENLHVFNSPKSGVLLEFHPVSELLIKDLK